MIESKKIDESKSGAYWATPHEMAARAFEAYIEDEILKQGESTYLVYGADNKFYRLFDVKPYPEGQERIDINNQIKGVFEVIKTDTNSDKMPLFSLTAKGNLQLQKPTKSPSKPSTKISKIQKIADRVTKGWKNKTPVTVVKDVKEASELYPNYNWTNIEDGQVAGFYDKVNKRVVVVGSHPMAENGAHVESVIFHEMIGHHGVRQLIKQTLKDPASVAEMNRKWDGLMDSVFAGNWNSPLMQSISQIYFSTSDTSSLTPIQMRIAADEYIAHRAQIMDFGGTMDKIVAFLRNLMRQMGMTLNHTDSEIRNMLSNSRRLVIDGNTASVREVDGESLPEALQMMKTQDQTQTEAFKAWFGDSKVVDSEGKPMVVYHGTASNFDVFIPNKEDSGSIQIPGLTFFSSSPEIASGFASQAAYNNYRPNTPNIFNGRDAKNFSGYKPMSVMPVYISMKNPLIVDGISWKELFTYKQDKYIKDPRIKNIEKILGDHDGIIFKNAQDIPFSEIALEYVRDKNSKGEKIQDVYAVLSPSQIKSATGNIGTFDASNPDIRFSLSPTQQQVENRKKTWKDRADKMYENHVDYMLHARRLVKSKLKGRQIADDQNFVDKENLAKGKTLIMTEQFMTDIWKPFLKASKSIKDEFGVNTKQISDYFYALHHPERKAYFIDKYNQEGRKLPKDDRWPTGMTDAESDKIIQDFETAVPQDRRDQIRGYVREMTELVNQRRLATGIINQETFDQLTEQYNNYVPLRGFEDLMGIDDTVYSPLMSAKGRESKAASPIPYLFTAVQEAIIRGENNLVRQAVLEFVKEFPSKIGGDYFIRNGYYVKTGGVDADGNEVWAETLEKPTAKQIKDGDAKRSFDELTHKHVKLFGEPENTLMVYVNGKRVFIEFKDQNIVKAIKNTSQDKVQGLMKRLSTFTRWLSSMRTQYSPEFGVTNLLRDVGFGSFVILAEKDFKTYKSTMSKMLESTRTLGNYFWTGKYDPNNPDSQMVKEWLEAGGMTGFTDLKEAKEIFEAAQAEIDGVSNNKWNESKEWLENSKGARLLETYNKTLESALRFSYYKALREQGVSSQSAAIQGKDLTVNFNRKGNSTSFIGAIYMFYNASVQGTEKLSSLFRNPKSRRKAITAMGTVMAAGFMQGMLYGLLGGDDEDEKGFYAKIPDYVRRTNIIIPWPGKDKYLKIPMPYGVNTFYVFGESIASAIFNDKEPSKEAIGLLSAVADSFSPIGGFDFESDANFFQKSIMLLSPTIARPIGELAFNQNFAGGQIYRENFTKGQYELPNSQMYFPGVNPIAKGFTEGLRAVSGGDKIEPGLIEINPEWVEHGFTTYLGGPASFSNSIISTGSALFSGENIFEDPFYRKIPFLRRFFVKAGGQYNTQQEFYERYNDLKVINDRMKIYEKTRPEILENYYEKHGREIELFNMADEMRNSVSDINDAIKGAKSLPLTPELNEEIEKMYDEKDLIMKQFNKEYNIRMKQKELVPSN